MHMNQINSNKILNNKDLKRKTASRKTASRYVKFEVICSLLRCYFNRMKIKLWFIYISEDVKCLK